MTAHRGSADPLGWLTAKEPGRMVRAPDSAPDDAALVTRAIAGDAQAFEQLRSASEHVVRGTIRMQVGRSGDGGAFFVDHALVDDLVQTTWVQVWQKLPTYSAEIAGFHAFARYWARIMVRRYRDTPIGQGKETSISSLLDRDEADDSPTGSFDRLDAQAGALHDPDDTIPPEVYDELLTITFATASPPHQLLVFGFTKAADLKPRQIAADLSNVPLRTLAERLEQTYLEQSDLPAARIRPAFEPLHDRMDGRFDEVVRDPTTLATYPQLHERTVGDTTLADYYTGEPTANLTQWWHAVKRRVIADLQRRQDGPLAELLRQSQRFARRAAPAPASNTTSTRGAGQRISG